MTLSTTQLLRDLVSIPSVNPMGRSVQGEQYYEYRLTDYLEKFFQGLGVKYHRQMVAPKRDNIVAETDSDSGSPGLLFEVHQDTVPVENMTVNPYGAEIKEGKLYGRGACDVKGSMASMLGAFARLVREKPKGHARLVLACTVDEEYQFTGVQALVKESLGVSAAVVAEPTQLKIVNAHKGAVRWFIEALGKACHSSAPQLGENAIYRMAELLPHIADYAKAIGQKHKHETLGPATLSVGRIEGGMASNIVPDMCRIEIDRRLLPGEDPLGPPADLEAYLRERVSTEVRFRRSPPNLMALALSPEKSGPLVDRLRRTLQNVLGMSEVTAVPYGTDASTIAAAGIPSVVFGPGDIALAHTCDENVPLAEIETASEIYFSLARDFAI